MPRGRCWIELFLLKGFGVFQREVPSLFWKAKRSLVVLSCIRKKVKALDPVALVRMDRGELE